MCLLPARFLDQRLLQADRPGQRVLMLATPRATTMTFRAGKDAAESLVGRRALAIIKPAPARGGQGPLPPPPSVAAPAATRTVSATWASRSASGVVFRQIMPMVRAGRGWARRATATGADRVSIATAISGMSVTPIPAPTIWTRVESELPSIT